jgi:CRP-like cAMP-binding protein
MPASTQVNRPACTEVLRALLEEAASGALPEWSACAARIQKKQIERGGTLFLQDSSHPFVYGVRHGLVKLVYLEDGAEWIKSFVHEGGFFASIAALAPGGRTTFMALALEPVEVERIHYRVLLDFADRHLRWSRALHALTMVFAARKEQRERELLTLSAEARYLAFAKSAPALIARIPQKDLARHLGLTPVGLNRIVARVSRAG